jgi:putative membrane protein
VDEARGPGHLGLSPELAEGSAPLAMNQELYKLPRRGLLWLLSTGTDVKLFFLASVVIAGIFGRLTAKRTILIVQALPGAIVLALVWFAFA